MDNGKHHNRNTSMTHCRDLQGAVSIIPMLLLTLSMVGLCGCAEVGPEKPTELSFVQQFVGQRNNASQNGTFWGENITKIARRDKKTFTFVIDSDIDPRTTFLYEKTDGDEWIEGESFVVSRPPNILIDSAGHVQVVGFEPFDPSGPEHEGRLFYVRFQAPGTVSGSYDKAYITEDYRETGLEKNTYSTYYCGAAIGSDDTVLVVYNNSIQWDVPGTHSLGARIYNPKVREWTYETVADNMTSRHAYPFGFVSESHLHVLAIEDDRDYDYDEAGPPYSDYPYRYGMVTHLQRPRAGGPWEQTVLVDFNSVISKEELWHMSLKIVDFHVDFDGTVHALIRYNESRTSPPQCYHYQKKENETEWSYEEIPEAYSHRGMWWARIWERSDNALFYVGYTWDHQVWLTPVGTNNFYTITALEGDYIKGAVPFIASLRSGTAPAPDLDMVIYSSSYEINALSVHVSVLEL